MLRALWTNRKARSWAGQILLLGLGIAVLLWLIDNTITNLTARNIRVGFDFLTRAANFPISESLLPYSTEDSFLWAYGVGLGNTLLISVCTILLATVLGLIVGLARRSKHPLVGGFAGGFVTLMRNMPLIVQLLFWYALATTALPQARAALSPLPGVYLSLRGLYFPSLVFDSGAWALLAAAVVLGLGLLRLSAPWRGGPILPPAASRLGFGRCGLRRSGCLSCFSDRRSVGACRNSPALTLTAGCACRRNSPR
ncbi:ABC transporter permease subunit [Elstera litoralis]|uniref:ABC transporter permease subunit n=1 Tax=Elstera litoralis TaxID=552518 RepID=UPI0018DC4192|nr:ABC transporter permease subunit [Elstera litoralis]